MIKVVEKHERMMFDELEWSSNVFSQEKDIGILCALPNKMYQVYFNSCDRLITITSSALNMMPQDPDFNNFYFRWPSAYLLNELCKINELIPAIKRYCLKTKLDVFPIDKYNLLASSILGNHE